MRAKAKYLYLLLIIVIGAFLIGIGWLAMRSYLDNQNPKVTTTPAPSVTVSPTPELVLQDNQTATKLGSIDITKMNQGAPVAVDKIDLNYEYLVKGSKSNSIILGGFVKSEVDAAVIKLESNSADLKYAFALTCKVNADTKFQYITEKVVATNEQQGNLIRTYLPNTSKKIDATKVTFVEFQYGTDLLYSSVNNICISIHQVNEQ